MNNEKSYFTPAEVAEMLMVSPITVRKWAQDGELKAVTTPGGHRRFKWADIQDFSKKRELKLLTVSNKKINLLIVDDDRTLSGYLAELFSIYSDLLNVEVANDGFEAGVKLESFRPDIVLLDLMMPGIDGVAVCQQIKNNPENAAIRIIAMTGFHTPENEQRILNAGAEVCLKKPIDKQLLLELTGLSNLKNTS